MRCFECGKWMHADPMTGYDADSYCSAECEEKAWERQKQASEAYDDRKEESQS